MLWTALFEMMSNFEYSKFETFTSSFVNLLINSVCSLVSQWECPVHRSDLFLDEKLLLNSQVVGPHLVCTCSICFKINSFNNNFKTSEQLSVAEYYLRCGTKFEPVFYLSCIYITISYQGWLSFFCVLCKWKKPRFHKTILLMMHVFIQQLSELWVYILVFCFELLS